MKLWGGKAREVLFSSTPELSHRVEYFPASSLLLFLYRKNNKKASVAALRSKLGGWIQIQALPEPQPSPGPTPKLSGTSFAAGMIFKQIKSLYKIFAARGSP